MKARAMLAIWLSGAATLAAAETGAPSLQIEGGGSYENLDRRYDDWTGAYLDAAWARAPRNTLYGGLRRTEDNLAI